MKQVFNSNEVAHIWASQKQETGRNSGNNFYFRNKTIYSYGSHFPIATIDGNNVIMTMRSYSNTTAKHIQKTRSAISHMNVIYCYDVPVDYCEGNKKYFEHEHNNNIQRWKKEIAALFTQLDNKKNRNIEGSMNEIQHHISLLNAYCEYFKYKIQDKELLKMLKTAKSTDFLEVVRIEKEKKDSANAAKLLQSEVAYNTYIALWQDNKDEQIRELSDKQRELTNYYKQHSNTFTRLRLNKAENRLETSKGVQIPIEIAKRAYIQLNGCLNSTCNELSIPVMNYTITKTDKETITAGCHTIPKSDIKYIANLMQW